MKQKQVFNNAKWIIICRIVQSVMQLIIGMVSARYLGPSNYGLINYAASIVAFALPLMKLGLDAILVYELVESPEKEGEIIGSSLFLNVSSGLLCIVGVSVFAVTVNYGEKDTILICMLYSISILFAAFEMLQYWYQYRLLSKYASVIMLAAYLFVSAYKIFLLASAKSVYWFAASHSVEYGFISVLLFIFYYKNGGAKLSVSIGRMKKMLMRSKYYILAALMIVVIQNTDHIMLRFISGDAANGYYTAAVTSASALQFVFTAIRDSFRPLILSAKKNNAAEYEKNISRLYGIIIYLSIAQSLAFTIFAPWIIRILYGAVYISAVPVLRILIWYFAFSFMGTIRNIWLLAEGKQKYLPGINMAGCVLNILLNAFMIPLYGACGAAFSSFLTQVFMNFVLGFLIGSVRKNNKLMLIGLHPRFLVRELKSILFEIRKKE